eukprot:11194531-Lingulodinium_polyedra.AAC.1
MRLRPTTSTAGASSPSTTPAASVTPSNARRSSLHRRLPRPLHPLPPQRRSKRQAHLFVATNV